MTIDALERAEGRTNLASREAREVERLAIDICWGEFACPPPDEFGGPDKYWRDRVSPHQKNKYRRDADIVFRWMKRASEIKAARSIKIPKVIKCPGGHGASCCGKYEMCRAAMRGS